MNYKDKVVEIVKELSCAEIVELSDSLEEDLMLDSLAMVSLLLLIEETLGIELKESDLNPYDLSTVADVIGMVEKYCGDETYE